MDKNDIVQRLHEGAAESKQVLVEHLESLRLGEGDPKLDLAIAKAIGIKAVLHNGCVLITSREWDKIRGIEHTTCEGDVACIQFQPSVDLNAAFAAAEVAGVLKVNGDLTSPTYGLSILHYEYKIRHKKPEWVVRYRFGDQLSSASTPALAICGAILELKKRSGG